MADTNLVLNFTMEEQVMSFWCWAAVAKSTFVFYAPGSNRWTQCKIAKIVCTKPTCCTNPPGCNDSKRLSDALRVTGNYVNERAGTITWMDIKTEINAGRLVCARIQWNEGGGHFVSIYGVSKIGNSIKVYIADSIYGISIMTFTQFKNNYRSSGSWSRTYFSN